MGKTRRGTKELSREQRLSNENKKLKRELAQIRKIMARMDLDNYNSVKEIMDEHEEDTAQTSKEFLEMLKKTWACKDSGCQGYLEINLYNKVDQTWYYRRCSHCPNRTKAQKYSPDVKGIIKDS